jgi:hypothetical protein
MAQTQPTAWTEFFTPDASTDRGWFKAITEPYDSARAYEYTEATMPVWDEDINAWREQSTLGNYLDYRPCRPWVSADEPQIHCVCYVAHTYKYVMTLAEAREWIEAEALSVRPELAIQGILAV